LTNLEHRENGLLVCGSSVTSFLDPAFAALIGFITGTFLLLDPEDDSIFKEAGNSDSI